MRKAFSLLALLALAPLAALTLSSCGDVCAFGQGDCDQELSATNLTLAASTTSVNIQNNVTFTPSGGTKPYTYSIVVGAGNLNQTTGDTAVVTATQSGPLCVRATDANNNIADRCVTVN
jgi:hypothetical protein